MYLRHCWGGQECCGAEGHVCINEIRLYLKCKSECVCVCFQSRMDGCPSECWGSSVRPLLILFHFLSSFFILLLHTIYRHVCSLICEPWHRGRAKESFPSPIARSHCLLKHSLSHLHEWMLLCCNKWTIKKAGRQNVITEHLNDLPVKNHNLIPLNLLFQFTFEIQTLNSVFPQSIRWTNIP